jgi:hypothetical protein
VGAQPAILRMPHAAVLDMLLAAPLLAGESPYRPLARVRDLSLTVGGGGDALESSDVARLLRAAPELRKFNGSRRLQGGLDWVDHPAFTGLVHPWLRSVRVDLATHAPPARVDCAVQLRRLHFPRLQQLIVNSVEHLGHQE